MGKKIFDALLNEISEKTKKSVAKKRAHRISTAEQALQVAKAGYDNKIAKGLYTLKDVDAIEPLKKEVEKRKDDYWQSKRKAKRSYVRRVMHDRWLRDRKKLRNEGTGGLRQLRKRKKSLRKKEHAAIDSQYEWGRREGETYEERDKRLAAARKNSKRLGKEASRLAYRIGWKARGSKTRKQKSSRDTSQHVLGAAGIDRKDPRDSFPKVKKANEGRKRLKTMDFKDYLNLIKEDEKKGYPALGIKGGTAAAKAYAKKKKKVKRNS